MSKNLPLTSRQAEVLAAIRELSANGRAPTLAELGARVGMRGSWTVRRHLPILTARGFLRPRRYRKPRDITLQNSEECRC
jgi:SOS-response transcriptional repressor LexA